MSIAGQTPFIWTAKGLVKLSVFGQIRVSVLGDLSELKSRIRIHFIDLKSAA